jgi:hypothetical protein
MIQSFRKALFQKSLTFSFSSRQAIVCNKERVCAKEQVLVPALFDDEAFTSQAFLVFLYQFFAKVRFWSIFKCTSITKCLCVRTRATDLFATLADLGLHRLLVFGGLLRVTHGRIEGFFDQLGDSVNRVEATKFGWLSLKISDFN